MENAEEKIRRVRERMTTITSESGLRKGLRFEPRSTDVVIAGHPKTGTTWMQQIVHQLRTGGDEDFEDISLVVPLLEGAADLGQDLKAEQKALPRCFKVHHWFSPKEKGKYLVVLRHPYSVAYSDYKFNENWYFEPGELSLEEFIRGCWIPPRFEFLDKSYLGFVASWCAHRDNPNVMFVFYEDLIEDLETGVRRIAKFMGIDGEANVHSAVERSSFQYMKENWEKFNSNSLKQARNKHGGLKESAGMSRNKIRSGSTEEGKEGLSAHVRGILDSKWKDIVEAVTGFSTYEDLHKGIISS